MRRIRQLLIWMVAFVAYAVFYSYSYGNSYDSSSQTVSYPYVTPNTSNPNGTNRPVSTKYCCTVYLDYVNTIYVTNKKTGYLVQGTNDDTDSSLGDFRSRYRYTQDLGGNFRSNVNIVNVTNRDSGTGNERNDGQWLNCPAGFYMTGSSYSDRGSQDSSDAIFCVPLRQVCGYINPVTSTAIREEHYYPYTNLPNNNGLAQRVEGDYNQENGNVVDNSDNPNAEYRSKTNGVYTTCN